MRQTKKMKSKVVSIVLAFLLVAGCVHFDSVEAKASMASEAIDFQIGDTLQGSFMNGGETFYWRFSLDSRQRIVFKGISPDDKLRENSYLAYSPNSYNDKIRIYDAVGNSLVYIDGYSDLCWEYNATTDLYTLNLPVTLNKGTYFFSIYRHYGGSDYSFATEYSPSTRYPSMQLSITMNQGDSLKLGAVITPEKAASKLKWKSSDKSVAGVSSNGTVKAKKAGTATITASCNGSKIRIKIIVK